MKTLKTFALMLCAIVCAIGFTSCEDTTEDVYTIKVGEMSEAYSENAVLQTCVGISLAEYIATSEPIARTEKDAKIWLDGACEQVKDSWTIVNTVVTIKPDTWVMLDLVNSKNKVVKSKKVKFEEQN